MGPRRLIKPGPWMVLASLAIAALPGCKSSSPAAPVSQPLRLVATYTLAITEPSDLTIDENATTLWTVSNDPDSVYQLDMHGNRVRTLAYEGHDLEGITYDASDHTLWVAEENLRRVVHLDLDGNVLGSYSTGLTGQPNCGLEGIGFNGAGDLIVLNEKLPGLFVTLDQYRAVAATDTLTFAGDYSGITWDPHQAAFWIVSDQSKTISLWAPGAGVRQSYTLNLPTIEGVAFDPATHRIYLVSDTEHKLYVFEYQPPS